MGIKNTNLSKSIYFSLVVQIITSLISAKGLSYELNQNDYILYDILKLELVVQLIEAVFYIWVIYGLKNINLMTPRRYIDWMITTPTMLISTIMFMKYQEHKLNNKGRLTTNEFFSNEINNIKKIIIYNGCMLLFGYLGEVNKIPKHLSIMIGFIFFYLSFSTVYEYSKTTPIGKKIFYFLTFIWGMYGVSAMFNPIPKNISYNLLDIVSKNFYGIFIFYKIRQLRVK